MGREWLYKHLTILHLQQDGAPVAHSNNQVLYTKSEHVVTENKNTIPLTIVNQPLLVFFLSLSHFPTGIIWNNFSNKTLAFESLRYGLLLKNPNYERLGLSKMWKNSSVRNYRYLKSKSIIHRWHREILSQ